MGSQPGTQQRSEPFDGVDMNLVKPVTIFIVRILPVNVANAAVPVQDREDWTIVLMGRTTQFIWALGCGKKDHELFLFAIQILREVIERTGDVTLVTDGERCYGNILFEICHELARSGRRGPPSQVH